MEYEKAVEASKGMLYCLHRSFEVMNWFAGGDHHYMTNKKGEKVLRYGRTDTESVLAEVYGTLASEFMQFKEAVEFFDGMLEDVEEKISVSNKDQLSLGCNWCCSSIGRAMGR